MTRIRAWLIGVGLAVGIGLNVTVAPQIMTPRPPIFNGPDIASNWEWRSMAIHMHSWWLWDQFPEAHVTNVGFVPPVGRPEALDVGMIFSNWIDQSLGLSVDESLPPLDLSTYGIRDDLYAHKQVYSRIHCRIGQEMETRDTCYYFVAWDQELLEDETPTFVGVELNRVEGDEEMALVERRLLESLLRVNINSVATIDQLEPTQ